MAGPVILSLGPFAFEAHGFGFAQRTRSTGTKWAEIPVAGGLNPSQWTGGDGQVETIKGVLFPEEFGGDSSLAGLTEAAINGQVLPLVSLSGINSGAGRNIFDLWFIEGVDEDHDFIDAYGRPRKNGYQISIKAYQGGQGLAFNPLSVLSFF